MRCFYKLISVLVLSVSALTAAENNSASASLISGRGPGADARNLQIAVTLPAQLKTLPLAGQNFTVYVYPRQTPPAKDAWEPHRARNVFVWHAGEHVFLDVRTLPVMRPGVGDYAARIVLNVLDKEYPVNVKGAIHGAPEKTDVVLLIDTSLSMHRNDPVKKRVAAAQAFLRLAGRDGGIGKAAIVGFNDVPKVLMPLTAISSQTDGINPAIVAALKKINADGQTNIGKALLQAERLLSGSSRAAVIMLTDGRNESVPYADEHLTLARREIPVYAVGLSEQADQELLRTIANDTHGKSFWTANSRELTSLYLSIAAEIGSSATLLRRATVPGTEVAVPVDDTVEEISFLVDNPDAAWQLLPPPGAEGASAIRDYFSSEFAERRVKSPAPGIWTVRFPVASRPANLTVNAQTSLFIDAFPPVASKRGKVVGAVLANNGRPLKEGQVTLRIGDKSAVLFDDGAHGDGAANDGVYAAIAPVDATAPSALMIANDRAEKRFRRETPAWRWKQNSAYSLVEQIAVRQVGKIAAVLPGAEAVTEVTADYVGAVPQKKMHFQPCILQDAQGNKLTLSTVKIPRDYQLLPGTNVLPLRLPIPADQPAGRFQGTLRVTAGELSMAVPLALTVKAPVLNCEQTDFDLGWVRAGEKCFLDLPVKYDGLQAKKLPLTSLSAAKLLIPETDTVLVPAATVAKTQPLRLFFSVAEAVSGEHAVKFLLGKNNEITVRFAVAPRGRAVTVQTCAHEMFAVPAGEKFASALHGHEWQALLPTREVVTAAYAHELRLDYEIPETVAAVAETPGDTGRWIFLAVCGSVVLLLLFRHFAHNRILRFALLSAVIHVPVLGILAVYFWAPEPVSRSRPQLTARLSFRPETLAPAASVAGKENPILSAEKQILLAGQAPVRDAEDEVPFAGAVPLDMPSATPVAPRLEKSRPAESINIAEVLPRENTAVNMPLLPASVPLTLNRTPQAHTARPGALPQSLPRLPEVSLPAEIDLHAAVADGEKTSPESLPTAKLTGIPDMQPAIDASPVKPAVTMTPFSEVVATAAPDFTVTAALPSVHRSQPQLRKTAPEPLTRRAENPHVPALPRLTVPETSAENEPAKARKTETINPAPSALGKLFTAEPKAPSSLAKHHGTVTMADAPITLPEASATALSAAPSKPQLTRANPLSAAMPSRQSPLPERPQETSRIALPEVSAGNAVSLPRPAEKRLAYSPRTESSPVKRPRMTVPDSRPSAKITLPSLTVGSPDIEPASQNSLTRRPMRLLSSSPITLPEKPQVPDARLKAIATVADSQFPDAPRTSPNVPLSATASLMQAPVMAEVPGRHVKIAPASALSEIVLPEVPQETLKMARPNLSRYEGRPEVAAVSGWRVRMEQVNFSIGIAGVASDQDALSAFLDAQGMQAAQIAVTPKELANCGVALIAEKVAFTEREGRELRHYVDKGGRLWFHNCHGFPPALTAGGKVVRLEPVSRRALLGNAAEGLALELDGRIVAVADEGADRAAALPTVMNCLTGREIFINDHAVASSRPATLWQNFSGLDARNLSWKGEKWGNPVRVSLSHDGDGGEALLVNMQGGDSSRSAVSYAVPDSQGRRMNLSGVTAQIADIFVAGRQSIRVSMSLTNQTAVGWDEFETQTITLKPGWNRGVRFDFARMRSRRAESAADPRVRRGFAYGLHGADNCAKVTYYFHTRAAGDVLLDNLRWEQVKP